MTLLTRLQQAIGAPTQTIQDPRAGITAVGGNRETGAFAVHRDPVSTLYEVNLIPCPDSIHEFVSLYLNEAVLDLWVETNLSLIKRVTNGDSTTLHFQCRVVE